MPQTAENRIIVIGGPTASGKSGLALALAKVLDGVVVNADSMQVYQGLGILSAAPSAAEKQEVPHRLYEIFPPEVNGTVVEWLKLAEKEIRNIWGEGKIPVVAGGTGLYLDNLIRGTTPIPEPLPQTREKGLSLLAELGAVGMFELLRKIDPASAEVLNANDATRVRRAWEIMTDTGVSAREWFKKPLVKKLPEAEFFVVRLNPAKEDLDRRCYLRFEQMLEQGALEETAALLARGLDPRLPAMKMLGVPELAAYLRGETGLKEAKALAQLHTRQYAKRQRTWFNNRLRADLEISRFPQKGDAEELAGKIRR